MKSQNKINSLYLHIPFCHNICFYCDFPKILLIKDYVNPYLRALIKELRSYHIKGKLKTIYIGGGTPSCINLEPLFKVLQPYINKDTEFSVEGNVFDFNDNLLAQYKKYHVNRISLGVESTNNHLLKKLGRKHQRQDVFNKVKLIKRYIKNINVDLIYGFKELSLKTLKEELKDYLSLDVNHISTYALEIKPGTKYYNEHKDELDSSLVRDQFDVIYQTLTKHAYIRYETSNFAKPRYMSKHNLTYWRDEEYYGIGLGAASYINHYRYKNTLNIKDYIQGKYHQTREKINQEDDKKYYLMLKLRLKEGINLSEYKKRFNANLLSEKKKEIKALIDRGLLVLKNNNLSTSYEGSLLLDIILTELF